jgi:hypothetical protein
LPPAWTLSVATSAVSAVTSVAESIAIIFAPRAASSIALPSAADGPGAMTSAAGFAARALPSAATSPSASPSPWAPMARI